MNNKLKSELKVGDIYTFRVKRKQVKQIKKTYFPDEVWDIIKDFMIEYTHKTLTYETSYNNVIGRNMTRVDIIVETNDTIKEYIGSPNHIILSWDYENEKIDKIMNNDYRFSPPEKTNFMWIKIIKDKYHWKKGERLYLDMKRNCDGLFWVWGVKKREHKTHQIYINSKGFVVHLKADVKKYNITKNYKDVEYKYKLADCMYNDLLKLSSKKM